jgi:amidase
MVAVAHGNDGGGSIRIPASCCGLFGLKPSRGRVSKGPAAAESWGGFSSDHVLTRSVRDSAALLDVVAGYHPGDTFAAPAPARPFAREVGAEPGRLRVGILDHPAGPDYRLDPDCAEAVRATGRLLESLGHRVEAAHPASLGEADFGRHFVRVVAAAVAAALGEWTLALGRVVSADEYEPRDAALSALGFATSAPEYLESLLWLEAYRRRTVSFWSEEGFDLLCTPVLALVPARLGELSDPVEGERRELETLRFTGQFNVTGQPAASLPLHVSAEGLPIGVQLVADYGREDLLIRVASQLEEAAPWGGRLPPVHA